GQEQITVELLHNCKAVTTERCDGACMRSFHATKADGRESLCDSLGFTKKEVDDIETFYCKNCEYRQHQCFACGELGSSDKDKGAEVLMETRSHK
ncbi:protein binding protein, partial [Trifolium medium]|nr:protein binding protein [Trifolium medium]